MGRRREKRALTQQEKRQRRAKMRLHKVALQALILQSLTQKVQIEVGFSVPFWALLGS